MPHEMNPLLAAPLRPTALKDTRRALMRHSPECCIVSQLVRDDARWEVEGEAHFMQVIAQLSDKRFLAAGAR